MDAREHRWRLRLCAGLAVLATIGSLGVAAWLAGRSPSGRPPAVQTSDPAPRPLDLSALPPARQIWPAAVRTLPAHLPDGQAGYTVQAALPGDRYLVSYPGATGTVLAAFDTERATVTVLSTPTAYLLAGVPTVAGDRVTWVVAGTDAGGRPVAEIWVGSTAGGAPVRVARLTGADAGGVHRAWTVGDRVLWTGYPAGADRPAVYQAPLGTGTATAVPGAAGYALALEAWAVAPGSGTGLWNVVTGVRLPVPGGVRSCTPGWCVAQRPDGRFEVWRLDGGPAVPAPAGTTALSLAGGGRFAVGAATVAGRPVPYLWDLSSGRAGVLPFAADPAGPDTSVICPLSALQGLVEIVDLALVGRT